MREDFFRGAEAVGPGDTDREPDDAQQEVDHVQQHGNAEYSAVPPGRQVIDGDRAEQNTFGDDPDEGPPFDVVVTHATREVDLPDCKLRYDVICGRLQKKKNEFVS